MKVLLFALLAAISYAQTGFVTQKVVTGSDGTSKICAEVKTGTTACLVPLNYNTGYKADACDGDYYTVCDNSIPMVASTRKSLEDEILAIDSCESTTVRLVLRGTQETCPVHSSALTLEGNGCEIRAADGFDCVTTRKFGDRLYPIDKDTEYSCKITIDNAAVPDIEDWSTDNVNDRMTYTAVNGTTSTINHVKFPSKLSTGDVLEWKVPARSQLSGYHGWKICFRSTDFQPQTCKSWCGGDSRWLNEANRITRDQYCASENIFCSTCNGTSTCDNRRPCPDCVYGTDAESSSQSLSILFLTLTLMSSLFY